MGKGWAVVVGLLAAVGCSDDVSAPPSTTDAFTELPDAASTIDTTALFLRQEGDGGALACLNGGDSDPLACSPVFELPGLDLRDQPGVEVAGDTLTVYSVRLQGDLDGDQLTGFSVEAVDDGGNEAAKVEELDCPVPAGSGGDPQAVVDGLSDVDVPLVSAGTRGGEDPTEVIVVYLDRQVAEAVCGVAGPGVAVHVGSLSTVT